MGYAHRMKSRRHTARLAAAMIARRRDRHRCRRASPAVQAAMPACGLLRRRRVPSRFTPARIFDSRPGLAINDVAPLGAKPLTTGPAEFDIDLLGSRWDSRLIGQCAGRGGQPHGHRAGRQRLPRGIRQGLEAGEAHVDRQLRSERDRSQRRHRAAGRRRQSDDRPVRPERHGACLVDVFGWFSTSTFPARPPTTAPG